MTHIILIYQCKNHFQVFCRFLASVAESNVGMDSGFTEVVVQVGCHFIVADVGVWSYPKLDRTEDAAQAPHVLVFEVAAVAPSVNLHREAVTAGFHVGSHVKLGG